jgi:diketogulonate reductase-like aldo/keto reductase
MTFTRRDVVRALTVSAAVGGLAPLVKAGHQTQRAAGAAPGLDQPAEKRPDDSAAVPAVFRRRIPKTGELIPAIGMGTWSTFDVDPDGDLAGLAEVMRTFLNAGGSVIDSSPMYRRSEEVVGRVLALVGRTDLFYATKVWTDKGRDAGIEQMSTSMRHMGAKVMDLMQVHNLVDYKTHLPTLREWKAAGKIRYLGITEMRDFETVERLMREEKVDFIQIPYSIDDRRVEDRVLPAAAETGTAVLVMRPFGAGKLFDKVKDRAVPTWAAEFDCASWAQFFLKFLLAHPAVTCPIPATRNPKHMADNMRGGSGRLPDEAMRKKMVAELGA